LLKTEAQSQGERKGNKRNPRGIPQRLLHS